MLNTAAASSPILADGVFGSGTRDAVTAFQSQNGLAADGVVGPNTWGMLEAIAGQPKAQSRATSPVLADLVSAAGLA